MRVKMEGQVSVKMIRENMEGHICKARDQTGDLVARRQRSYQLR